MDLNDLWSIASFAFCDPQLQTCQIGRDSCKPPIQGVDAVDLDTRCMGWRKKNTQALVNMSRWPESCEQWWRDLLGTRVPSSTWQCETGQGCSGNMFHSWNGERIDFWDFLELASLRWGCIDICAIYFEDKNQLRYAIIVGLKMSIDHGFLSQDWSCDPMTAF